MTKNKHRQWLKNIIFMGCALIVISFLVILLQGMFWSPASQIESYQDISLGETRLQRIQQQRFWVTQLSLAQRQQLANLAPFVQLGVGCSIDSAICKLEAQSSRSGVLIQFIEAKPSQLSADTPWFGGFVDPTTGGVYDLLGRGYLQNTGTAKEGMRVMP